MQTNILYDHLLKPHLDNPEPFLVNEDGSVLSYKDYISLAKRLASFIQSYDLQKGDRVLVQLDKCNFGLVAYAASIISGLVILPLNPSYTIDETLYFIEDASPKIIFCSKKRKKELDELDKIIDPKILAIDSNNENFDYLNDFQEIEKIENCSENDLIAILYTSGTTGKSKGAMLSHINLISNAQSLVEFWQISSQDILIHMLPIFHTHGLFVAINTSLLKGVKVLFYKSFKLDSLLDILPDATLLMGVPTFYSRLNNSEKLSKALTKKMRLFISGSAPLSASDHLEFFKKTGHHILERYGMTETNMNTSNPYHGVRKPGSIGIPLPNIEVRIQDPEKNTNLSQNQIGMIQVKGKNVFQSYWGQKLTSKEFTQDGFFVTGDLGYFDQEGYFFIVGREKDLIISGGFNIYPVEIENIINNHPGVLESAVVGIKDEDLGEVPVAAVVLKNNNPDEEKVVDQLNSILERSLAKFKIPKKIKILGDLPKNTMGKVQKNFIRDCWD